MPVVQQKPVTPSGRFYFKNKVELSDKRPEKSLTKGVHRKKGRNAYGRITSRRRGGPQAVVSKNRLPEATLERSCNRSCP